MKTATKLSLSGTALGLVLLLSAAPFPALAADNAPGSSIAMNAAEPPASPMTLPPLSTANSGASNRKNLSALEDKVQDSVKNVVKQLSTIDNVSLDDLNSARQAVVKLEVLIDIEKHLAELEKIRSDHGSEKSFAAAIPASALSAPPSMANAASRTHTAFEAPAYSAPAQHTDVTRVAGSDGHYTALIQGKFLQVGDSLPDGSTIVAISPKDVSAKAKDGAVRRLKVHGIDEVYGHSL
jgi:hypothetical protein